METWLAAVSAGMSGVMCGLVWFVQVVHYPLMGEVGRGGDEAWRRYHAGHSRLTTWVVAPVMLAELGTALGLVWLLGGEGVWVWWQAGLAVGVWGVTFGVQVPQHGRLGRGYDAGVLRRLVLGNWVRVLLWTGRFGLMLWGLAVGVR